MTIVTFNTYAPLSTPIDQPLLPEHPPVSSRWIALDFTASAPSTFSRPPPLGDYLHPNSPDSPTTTSPVFLDQSRPPPVPKAPSIPELVNKIERLLRNLSGIPPPPLPYRRALNAKRSAPLPPQSSLAPVPLLNRPPTRSYRNAALQPKKTHQFVPLQRQFVPLRQTSRQQPALSQGPPPIPYHSRPSGNTLSALAQPRPLLDQLHCLSRKQLIDLLREALDPLALEAPQTTSFRGTRHRAFRGQATSTQPRPRAYQLGPTPNFIHPSRPALRSQNDTFISRRQRSSKRSRRS
jgi:hypothetical protein